MNILFKILPVILISLVFYLLIYNLYPKYQETLSLVKKLNELKNKEKEINALEKLIKVLNQNANLQQILSQKETLNIWLPAEPKIEEIIFSLNGLYQSLNLNFPGTDFSFEEKPKSFHKDILPVKIINFQLLVNLNPNQITPFIDGIEKNTRLMRIKKIILKSTEKAAIDVESYYLPKEQ